MEIGIVGLPNVGKSSLFNALTSASVPSENFPFTTINANIGVVPVRDPRLDALQKIFQAPKKVPASVKFVDIAGLVPGAHKNEGMGNKFLADIRSVDAIAQVIRCFDDADVVNVLGDLDPIKDAETISLELILADLQFVEKLKDTLQGAARTGQKDAKEKLQLLDAIQKGLESEKPIRTLGLDSSAIHEFNFLTAKPILYVANTGEKTSPELIQKVRDWATKQGASVVELNAKLEAEVMALPEEEQAGYREALGMTESGLDRLARAGQQLLGLISFFAAGPKEAHAWHIVQGSPAPKAAGRIHSDMEKGFIRASVYSSEELIKEGAEAALRAKGRIRMEGKDYIVQDGDVLEIHFNQ